MPLQPPPLDQYKEVIPHDHDGIAAGDGVIRRISEMQIVSDDVGQRRISTIAFKASSDRNGGMSVDLEKLIEEAGIDANQFVTTPTWTGSVRFKAGVLRDEGFKVGFHPLPENPYHGEVWGQFTKAKQRRLRELAIWFVPIPGVIISAA